MAPQEPSEEILGRKWDRCLANTTIKIGTGAVIGTVVSLIFFKRKSWPITLATGIGLGMGYANCQHTFRSNHPPHPRFGPLFWKMDPEAREKLKKRWEEKWKSFKPKEIVDEKKPEIDIEKKVEEVGGKKVEEVGGKKVEVGGKKVEVGGKKAEE